MGRGAIRSGCGEARYEELGSGIGEVGREREKEAVGEASWEENARRRAAVV